MNYKEREIQNRKRLTEAFGDITENSGIYVFVRYEGGFKYGYGGQAKHLQTRIAQHLDGYDSHIDFSIKKHGLYNKETCPHGWRVLWAEVPIEYLDEAETAYIQAFASQGYQMLNKTSGGQGEGKYGIAPNKPSKGYRDGIAQGEKNIKRQIAILFEKYLDVTIKGSSNKIKERKLAEFQEFLKGVENGQEEV